MEVFLGSIVLLGAGFIFGFAAGSMLSGGR